MASLPDPRGETSELLLDALAGRPGELPVHIPRAAEDPLAGEDLQLALYLCYELHYRGLAGVDERWEWDPGLLALRAALEEQLERGLLDAIGPPAGGVDPDQTDLALRAIADADEYGGGRPERIHAELFAQTMEGLGLDRRYGAYLDHVPGVTLATVNLMSLFGLHRRLRGAIVGHLALFEMTSSIPNARYARGLRRLGFDDATVAFFDEHVEADAVHENVAAVDLAGGLVRQEPAIGAQVLWGARALALLDERWGRHVLGRWEARESSLRVPLEAGAPA